MEQPMQQAEVCLICRTLLAGAGQRAIGDFRVFGCPRCGEFGLSETAIIILSHDQRPFSDRERAILCHSIRRMHKSAKRPALEVSTLESLLKHQALPNAAQQADNLVSWLGESAEGPGQIEEVDDIHQGGILGALNADGFQFVVESLLSSSILIGRRVTSAGAFHATLSFSGWARFEELRKGRTKGLRAFMAMKFRNDELNRIYLDYLRPAAARAGFELRKVDEEPEAGLIDNLIRVQILEAQFVVADLSDENAGAYWEAGYAEGLGKRVIYLCDQRVYEKQPTHFDTNHSLTITWHPGDPKAAADRLKAAIRATFPADAKMRDDEVDLGG